MTIEPPQVGISKKRKLCPRCNSRNVVQIIYGYPSQELEEREGMGEVELGGCLIWPGQPQRRCRDCGYLWRATEGEAGLRTLPHPLAGAIRN